MNKLSLRDREAIIEALKTHHQDFFNTIEELEAIDFERVWKEKWTPGQQLLHIHRSIKSVAFAFSLPRFVIKMKFGIANRPSRSYEELVAQYLNVLKDKTPIAPKEYQPKFIYYKQKNYALNQTNKSLAKILKSLHEISEESLDLYILPHPLIGKLTLREILYFTIYHVQHHHKITQEILFKKPFD